jgi:hypothetical protein
MFDIVLNMGMENPVICMTESPNEVDFNDGALRQPISSIQRQSAILYAVSELR